MNDERRKQLSLAVQDIIESQGLKSIRGFAKKYEFSPSTVRQWVEMETFPSELETFELLAELRGQTLQQFLDYLRGRNNAKPTTETVDDVFERVRRLKKRDRVLLTQRLVEDLAG